MFKNNKEELYFFKIVIIYKIQYKVRIVKIKKIYKFNNLLTNMLKWKQKYKVLKLVIVNYMIKINYFNKNLILENKNNKI